MQQTKLKTVDEYFASFPENTRDGLEKIRQMIKKEVPESVEILSYQMPAFKLHGRILVYYAAWKEHIGLYSFSSSIIRFKKELANYETSKGTIKFSLDKELPVELIRKIVKFRVKENLEKERKKK